MDIGTDIVKTVVARLSAKPSKELELTQQRFEKKDVGLKGTIFNAVKEKTSNTALVVTVTIPVPISP